MTKPWEETWRAVSAAETGGSNELHYGEGQVGCLPWGVDEDDMASARLASAAPDLVRVLLAVEWGGYLGECPVCSSGEPRGHAPDCTLDAALRKAGVR